MSAQSFIVNAVTTQQVQAMALAYRQAAREVRPHDNFFIPPPDKLDSWKLAPAFRRLHARCQLIDLDAFDFLKWIMRSWPKIPVYGVAGLTGGKALQAYLRSKDGLPVQPQDDMYQVKLAAKHGARMLVRLSTVRPWEEALEMLAPMLPPEFLAAFPPFWDICAGIDGVLSDEAMRQVLTMKTRIEANSKNLHDVRCAIDSVTQEEYTV